MTRYREYYRFALRNRPTAILVFIILKFAQAERIRGGQSVRPGRVSGMPEAFRMVENSDADWFAIHGAIVVDPVSTLSPDRGTLRAFRVHHAAGRRLSA